MQKQTIIKESIINRFWIKVDKTNSCWNWVAAKDSSGYGVFRNGVIVSAHRFSYELHKDKIFQDMKIGHLCRNRKCVNPIHLEQVTHTENAKKGNGGLHELIKTHCQQGHEYNNKNTGISICKNKNHKRYCRICRKLNTKKWNLSNPEKYKNIWKKYNLKKYHGRLITQDITQ